jgi:hypothetical protein
VVSFSAITTIYGVGLTVLSTAAGKSGFLTATAMSMTGVRYRDVKIESIAQTLRRELGSVDNRIDINSSNSFSERDEGGMEKFYHELTVHRKLATACIVTWNISVALRLSTTSWSTAYASMTSQLSAAISSGSFEAIMKSQST